MPKAPDDDLVSLFDELLDLVPPELHQEFGEVFYSGASAFEQPSLLYILGFNPGGDPSKAELSRYTIGADLWASRAPQRRDWSGFEDDWREFGPGAVAFQRRVRHLLAACGIEGPRKVPASNVLFVRSTRIEALDPKRTQALLRDCWVVHERVISALGVRVVVCLGQATGRWVRARVGASDAVAIDSYTETNGRRWRSTTHHGKNGIGSDADPSERGGLDQPAERPNGPRGQSTGARKTLTGAAAPHGEHLPSHAEVPDQRMRPNPLASPTRGYLTQVAVPNEDRSRNVMDSQSAP